MNCVFKVVEKQTDTSGYSQVPSKLLDERYFDSEEKAWVYAKSLADERGMKPLEEKELGKVCYRASRGWDDVHYYLDVIVTKHEVE